MTRNVVGSLSGLKSLTFTVEIQVTGYNVLHAQTIKSLTTLQVSMKKGGKFRVDASVDDEPTWAVVCDGSYVAEWSGKVKYWTQYPVQLDQFGDCVRRLVLSRAEAGRALGLYGDCWLEARSLCAERVKRLMNDPRTRLVGIRDVAGRKCHMIEVNMTERGPPSQIPQSGSDDCNIYFDQETYLPARETERFGGGPFGIPLAKGEVDVLYSKMTTDPELSDEVFVFEPPAGSKFISPDDPRIAPPPKLDGKSAPEFSLATLDGRTCKLADHRGKRPVLLVFWATWCGPCNEEIPFLKKLRAEHPEERLAILAVSDEANADGLRSFAKKKKLNYTLLHDANKETSKAYQARAIPRSILIDKTGKVTKIWQGWAGEEEAKEIRAEIVKLVE